MDAKQDEILNILRDMRAEQRELAESLSVARVVQAEQKQILTDHMRRSAANEEAVLELRNLVLVVKDGLTKQLSPIQKHVDRVQFLFVIVVGAGAVVGAVMTIIEALEGALK